MKWFRKHRGGSITQTATTGSNSSTVQINDVSYTGSTVSIVNGVITVDGKTVKDDGRKTINIQITGSVNQLHVDCCAKLEITGDVSGVETVSGNVKCGNVSGSVGTVSGNVYCKEVAGDVSTVSGDVISN